MQALRKKLGVVQNLGWLDRSLRMIVGWIVIAIAYVDLYQGAMFGWHAYAIVFSVYPILTALFGWDPLYSFKGVKTCDTKDSNRCGTFPFEIQSAMGHHPPCRTDYDCSISEPGEKSK